MASNNSHAALRHLPRPSGWPAAFTCAVVFLLAFAAHALAIWAYAVDLPTWDQWNGEGSTLLKLWAEGTLSVQDLIRPHNEHRILFSRLLSIAVFELDGEHWGNLKPAYVSAALYASTLALMCAFLLRDTGNRLQIAVAMSVLVVASYLPFGSNNTLVSFQSQFYFLQGFALAGLGLAAFGRDRPGTIAALVVVAFASLWTMASGLLTAPAIVVVLAARFWLGRLSARTFLTATVLLGLVAVLGFALLPSIEGNAALRAQTFEQFLDAATIALGWPATDRDFGALVLWLPSAIAACRVACKRWRQPSDLMMLGLAAFVFAQALAMSYARAGELTDVPSRYADIIVLGIAANLWFATKLIGGGGPGEVRSAEWRVLAIVPLALSAFLLYQGVPDRLLASEKERDELHLLLCIQSIHVADYLRTGQESNLHQPFKHVPFPNVAALQEMLDDATIRHMLVEDGVALPFPDSCDAAAVAY